MKHILIINQHGENRGDEAAMRAMLARFHETLGEVRFTLLYQFRDRQLRLEFEETVDSYPIVLPLTHYLRAAVFSLGISIGIEIRALLPDSIQAIITAYKTADLVVSAPGGPYFGDIYAQHELIHWWYVWLAHIYDKPLFLYAPSAGPFQKPLLNIVRRWLYRKFEVLVAREEFSAAHLRKLLGPDSKVHVTADSAIQVEVSAFPRDSYFTGSRKTLKDKFLVAVSLNQYRYPDDADPDAMRRQYDKSIRALIEHLARKRDCHFLFLPQLYGQVHSDVQYLTGIGESLSSNISWELVDPQFDATRQRQIFAMSDIHLASRYHPAIFGNTSLVPGICIYYEHKALGFMQQLGLERFAVDIRRIDTNSLLRLADHLLEERELVVAHLRARVPALREQARQTTELAVALLHKRVPRSSPELKTPAGN